jgi:hypothetical protein
MRLNLELKALEPGEGTTELARELLILHPALIEGDIFMENIQQSLLSTLLIEAKKKSEPVLFLKDLLKTTDPSSWQASLHGESLEQLQCCLAGMTEHLSKFAAIQLYARLRPALLQ